MPKYLLKSNILIYQYYLHLGTNVMYTMYNDIIQKRRHEMYFIDVKQIIIHNHIIS